MLPDLSSRFRFEYPRRLQAIIFADRCFLALRSLPLPKERREEVTMARGEERYLASQSLLVLNVDRGGVRNDC